MKPKLPVIFAAVFSFFAVTQSLYAAAKPTVSGFVDMSFVMNQDVEIDSTFNLDQAELDIEHKVSNEASARIDLQYLPTKVGYVSNVNVADVDTGSVQNDVRVTDSKGAFLTWQDIVEQAFINYSFGRSSLKFGTFNAPIGFERLDAPDIYQYSHSMVFNYGVPKNLTGAMVNMGGDKFDLAIYYVNGWDNMTDDSNDKTFGGRLGLNAPDGVIGISYVKGEEFGASGILGNRTVLDIDLTYTAYTNMIIGAQYNSGTQANGVAAGIDGKWDGFLVMTNYTVSDVYSITLRYDSFTDDGGTRMRGVALGGKETRTAMTAAMLFPIAEGLAWRLEYKTTSSDQPVFPDSSGAITNDGEEIIAAELTYSF
ncbi:MAG: hypothetical protein IEMM0002_0661 [bacterium]|nr:MAG: hypothetical protein IEMM0002_0661 [bacterium]